MLVVGSQKTISMHVQLHLARTHIIGAESRRRIHPHRSHIAYVAILPMSAYDDASLTPPAHTQCGILQQGFERTSRYLLLNEYMFQHQVPRRKSQRDSSRYDEAPY